MERDEYLAWCKDRAMVYWRAGDMVSAVTSLMSDLKEREDLRPSQAMNMLALETLVADDVWLVRDFIQGFR